MTLPIDVGSPAIDRGDFWPGGNTYIDLANPANLSGWITSVDVWAVLELRSFRVGVFSLVSGTTYRCQASATIGTVAAGSKQTFPVSLPVQKGSFIGEYAAAGSIELDTSGGVEALYYIGEAIDPGDEAEYTSSGAWAISLFGQGVVRGWSSK